MKAKTAAAKETRAVIFMVEVRDFVLFEWWRGGGGEDEVDGE